MRNMAARTSIEASYGYSAGGVRGELSRDARSGDRSLGIACASIIQLRARSTSVCTDFQPVARRLYRRRYPDHTMQIDCARKVVAAQYPPDNPVRNVSDINVPYNATFRRSLRGTYPMLSFDDVFPTLYSCAYNRLPSSDGAQIDERHPNRLGQRPRCDVRRPFHCMYSTRS